MTHLSLICCAAALLLVFIRFLEFDAPLTRFVRSLNEYQIDYLHNPWLRALSDTGDRFGRGESLLVVSAGLLLVGYTARRATFKRAGWETLLAHVVAGGVNTALKHLVGRGRPKFMHTDTSVFVPFGGKGWDSFPSGHSMAAFAIAAVLAVRFPRLRWLIMIMALAVSASRLFRASHFLTDIVAGAVLGVLIGSIVAHPWNEWRLSFRRALFTVMPPLAALLAIMTTMAQSPSERGIAALVSQGGLLLAFAALITYLFITVRPAIEHASLMRETTVALMGLGIATYSGSIWVAVVILLLCLAHWWHPERELTEEPYASSSHAWPTEAGFGLAVLLTLFSMMELRGTFPIG
ncbi:MAG TPA: phosphatase PAP2 family protein [Nitrospira sp.]|nr:phosphatase PAP2 family protein [Nitrospira sp.]